MLPGTRSDYFRSTKTPNRPTRSFSLPDKPLRFVLIPTWEVRPFTPITSRNLLYLIREDYCSNIGAAMQERKLRRGSRRRSERLSAQIPIQLAGVTETGQQFIENAQTLTLSQCGASMLSKRQLIPNQEMIIRRLDTGKEATVRVAGRIGDRIEGYVYAVEFVDPQVNLWETEFPSTSNLDEPEDRVFLACGCCGKLEAVQLGESKLEDFEVAHGVLLYCMQCQAMTRWMPRSDEANTW